MLVSELNLIRRLAQRWVEEDCEGLLHLMAEVGGEFPSYQRPLQEAAFRINEGEPVWQALHATRAFSEQMILVVFVAETTGTLDAASHFWTAANVDEFLTLQSTAALASILEQALATNSARLSHRDS